MTTEERAGPGKVIDWLGSHERSLLAASMLMVVVGWALMYAAHLMTSRGDLNLDDRILIALRRHDDLSKPIGPAWVEGTTRDVTSLGSTCVLWLATLGVAGFLGLDRRYRAMLFVFVAVLSGWGASFVLKDLFHRDRPTSVPHLMPAYFSSFPSGHSMMSAVVYFTLGSLLSSMVVKRRIKVYFLATAGFLSILVGISRLVLGVHYPSDVAAGWLFGLAWAFGSWHLKQRLDERGVVESKV